MHTFLAPVRAYQLATLLCVILLLAPPSAVESAAPPPSIEKLSIEALNRLIADPQETLLVFFTAAWCGHCWRRTGRPESIPCDGTDATGDRSSPPSPRV